MEENTPLTQLLQEWRLGDKRALQEITPIVYETLRKIGSQCLSSESQGLTLQATEVVHEAFLRLVGADVDWQNRAHFYAIAARTMRRILVDHARAKSSKKRGGEYSKITLDTSLGLKSPTSNALLDIDRALKKLSSIDERKSAVLEQHVFGGLSYDETAEVLNISVTTVDRDLRFARAWMHREIGSSGV